MAWRYHKQIKILPDIHLSFSKNGISTSIGPKGESVTFSDNKGKPVPANYFDQPSPYIENIFSVNVQKITSQDMQGIKEAILAAHEQREDLKKDLIMIKSSLAGSKFKLSVSYFLLYGLIKKSISQHIKQDINAKKETIKQLEGHIENCYVRFEIEFDPKIREKYEKVVESFKKLSSSMKIWDVTSENYENRVATRSAASTVVNKREVKFGIQPLADIKSKYEALWFKNANGADLYFYPHFIVMHSNQNAFALIGLHEINFYHNSVRFIETGTVPSDSKIIDKTWAKVNKNGTPDRRFKDNYQIPVVKYGEISLSTNTGLNEQYQFSSYEDSEEFAKAFREYQQIIKSLKPLFAQSS